MKNGQGAKETGALAVGVNIRELRRRAHLSQGEFARRLGMRQGPVCNLELGKNYPSAQVLIRIANVLDVTIDEILRNNTQEAEASRQGPASSRTSSLPVIRHPVNTTLYLASSLYGLDENPAARETVEKVVRDYLALEDICQVPRQARIPLQVAFKTDSDGIARLANQFRTLFGVAQAVVFDHYR
jgi:transcriptional regulator with XRE-family HTH domain